MNTPTRTAAAALILTAVFLAGWANPEAAEARAQPADCRASAPAVPADYLLYHALVSPHAALAAPRPDAPCAAATRRVRT